MTGRKTLQCCIDKTRTSTPTLFMQCITKRCWSRNGHLTSHVFEISTQATDVTTIVTGCCIRTGRTIHPKRNVSNPTKTSQSLVELQLEQAGSKMEIALLPNQFAYKRCNMKCFHSNEMPKLSLSHAGRCSCPKNTVPETG